MILDLNRICGAAVVVLVAAVYVPSLSGGFLADDWAMIVDNGDRMQGFAAIRRFFTAGVWESSNLGHTDTALYRPVWLMWNFVQYNLFGENPFPWRVASLALHLTNTLLVFALLRRLLPALTSLEVSIGAVIFALHPAKTQNVAWISGSTDLVLTFFWISAVLLFLRHRRTGSVWALMGAAICYLGAALTKEPGIVLPVALLAIDLWHEAGRRGAGKAGSWFAAYGIFGAIAAFCLMLRGVVLGGALQGEANFSLTGETIHRLVEYLLSYLGLLVLPWPVPYYFRHVDASIADPLTTSAGIALAVVVAIAVWRGRVTRVAAIWIGISLVAPLLLALHNFGLFGPRFLYLPSVGALLLAGAGYSLVKRRLPALATLAGAVPVVFAGLTILELPNWRSELTWSALILAGDPSSRYGWAARAGHFQRLGEPEKAAATWRDAASSVTAVADRAMFREQVAVYEAERGRYEASLEVYREISALPGFEAEGFIGMGNNYWVMQRPAEALEAYDRALGAEPANPLALYNRARLSEAQGDTGAALAHYRRLLDLPEKAGFEAARMHARDYVARRGGS